MWRRLIGLSIMVMAAAFACPAQAEDSVIPRDLSSGILFAPLGTLAISAAPDYRLRAEADIAPVLNDDQASRVRRGFGAAMRDYFPFGDGFHLSGGTRFYSRGFAHASRRITPALTIGYTRLIRQGVSLGIEGGAVLGRFDTLAGTLARLPRLHGDGPDGTGQLSRIARMTFGYHF